MLRNRDFRNLWGLLFTLILCMVLGLAMADEGLISAGPAGGISEYSVNIGETVTLTVTVDATQGAELSYQWYDYDSYEGRTYAIYNATESSYTTEPLYSQSATIRCVVWDNDGNTDWVDFTLTAADYIDNGFQVSAGMSSYVTVYPGGSETLYVSAYGSGESESTISCQWAYRVNHYNENGEWYPEWVPLNGVTDVRLELNETNLRTAIYRCIVTQTVTDPETQAVSKNAGTAYYNVIFYNLDNAGFEAHPNSAALGTSVPLTVTVPGALGKLSYQWYQGDQEIEGATGPCYTIPAVNSYSWYGCEIKDTYGNTKRISTTISVDNGLTLKADQACFPVLSGSNVKMTVTETHKQGKVSIKWLGLDENNVWQVIEGKTSETLDVENITTDTRYQCNVTDDYENTASVEFFIVIVDPSKAPSIALNGSRSMTVGSNGQLELLRFEAPADGTYQFASLGLNDSRTEAQTFLFDAELNELMSSDLYFSDFRMLCDLQSEEICYLGIRYENETTGTAFTVSVSEINAQELTAGETATVQINVADEMVLYSFTPTKDAFYSFCSVGEEYTTGYLYDQQMNSLTGVSSGSYGGNFRIDWPMKAGKRYYLGAKFNSEKTGSFTVSLDEVSVTELTLNTDATATISSPGERALFSFTPEETADYELVASPEDGSYLRGYWYSLENEYLFEGNNASGQRIRLMNSFEKGKTYIFAVGYNSEKTGSFTVRLQNAVGLLSAERAAGYDGSIYIPLGETAELKVATEATEGTELHYRWYDYAPLRGSYVVPDATVATYTTAPLKSSDASYKCTVSDNYGNEMEVWFFVNASDYMTTGLSVTRNYRDNDTVYLDQTDNQATLKVTPAGYRGDVSYEWRYEPVQYDAQGNSVREWKILEGATTDSYALSLSDVRVGTYRCIVMDTFSVTDDEGSTTTKKCTAFADFEVRVRNNLSVVCDDYWPRVPYGESATISVTATCDIDPDQITYQWFKLNQGNWKRIAGATSSSYVTQSITYAEDYLCMVYDQYGNSNSLTMTVSVDNGLNAWANGSDYFLVKPGNNSITMTVAETHDQGSAHYLWERLDQNGAWQKIEGQDSESCMLTNVAESGLYHCYVTDDFGNGQYVGFHVWAADLSKATAISLDTQTDVNIGTQRETVLFSFIPTETGTYKFFADDTYWSAVGTIYDDLLKELAVSDNSSSFQVSCELTEGTTYYIGARYRYENTGSYTVTLSGIRIQELELSVAATAEISEPEEIAMFSFTPDTTGFYSFYSMGEDNTYGYLYDERMNVLTETSSGGIQSNFKITRELTAGTMYYFGASYYGSSWSDTGSFSVILTAMNITALTPGRTATATIAGEGEVALFSFTPATTGYYTFYTTGDESYSAPQTAAYLYDQNLNQLKYAYGSNSSFSMNVRLTGGTKYYFGAGYTYTSTGSYTVALRDSSPIPLTLGEAVEAMNPGAGGVVLFSFTPAESGYYEYHTGEYDGTTGYYGMDELYLYDDELAIRQVISGYGSNGVRLVAEMEAGKTYLLGAKFESRYSTGSYKVCMDNAVGLVSAGPKDGKRIFEVDLGETVILEVAAEATEGEQLYYRWSENYATVYSATGPTFTIPSFDLSCSYYTCSVRDAYGHSMSVSFSIYPKDDEEYDVLTASAVSSTYVQLYPQNPQQNEAVLSVSASSTAGPVSYQWWLRKNNGVGVAVWEEISGAQSESLSLNATNAHSGTYRCSVTDGVRRKNVDFNVQIRSLEIWRMTQSDFVVSINQPVRMGVSAESTNGDEAITYQWSRYDITSPTGYVDIDDATGPYYTPSFTEADLGKSESYVCYASDGSSVAGCFFTVEVVALSANPDGEDYYYGAGDLIHVSIDPWEGKADATFSVLAKSATNDLLSYQWYRQDQVDGTDSAWTALEGETTKDLYLNIDNARTTVYRCIVSDQHDNQASVEVHVHVETLKVQADGSEEVTACVGRSATLKVNASTHIEGGEITYRWNTYDGSGPMAPEIVFEETGDTLVTPVFTENDIGSHSYWCRISDGNQTKSVWFGVTVTDEFVWNDPTYQVSPDFGTVTATRTCQADNVEPMTETVEVLAYRVTTLPTRTKAGKGECKAVFQTVGVGEVWVETTIPAFSQNALVLPSGLTTIESSAFEGLACEIVVIPRNCELIADGAFANCQNLRQVFLPADTQFETDFAAVFGEDEDLIVWSME